MMNKTKQYRLLIVDDEVDLRNLLSEILRTEGYDIVTAPDGADAIRLLDREQFDATLLDIFMPRLNGISVLKYINENHPATKTIIVTGHPTLENALEAKRNGAVDFISKPYKLETILSTLERVLNIPPLRGYPEPSLGW